MNASKPPSVPLEDGDRIAVMGGGPAGAMFSFFLLDIAERMGLDVALDLYEPKDFKTRGPTNCNMCGGIISESLVQRLATEGINLPQEVVQRGIASYQMHTDVGGVRIDAPGQEKRIAAVHRGAGPMKGPESKWGSFDHFLLSMAVERGAHHIRKPVTGIAWQDGKPLVTAGKDTPVPYELIAVATGVNTAALKLFPFSKDSYKKPVTTRTFIREYYLGQEAIERSFGDSMHVYLHDIPRLKFAAIIPKGECATLCLMGNDLDKTLLEEFLELQSVKTSLAVNGSGPNQVCGCAPRMNVSAAVRPYDNRIVFIGDAGVSRLYKDGIGAAYRTAKAAAVTAVCQGVGHGDFKSGFEPECRAMRNDNRIGKIVFLVTTVIQRSRILQRAVLRMVEREQKHANGYQRMSDVLWDTFTGSATYTDIFLRSIHPKFLWGLLSSAIGSILRPRMRHEVQGTKR